MFTSLQNKRLEQIMADKPRSIKDLALLSLASRQSHPKMMEWYMTAASLTKPYLIAPISLHSFVVTELSSKLSLPPFKLYVTHIKDCYYIGELQCYGNVRGLKSILEESGVCEFVCRQCLKQVSSVLCHLKEKDIHYVHGKMSVENIMEENGKFYILDNGFERKQHATDPYFCYKSPTYDLYTLCSSMRSFFKPGTDFHTFLSGSPVDTKFLPETLQEKLSGNVISMYLKGLSEHK